MKRVLTILALLLVAAPVMAAPYGWTISSSSTNALVNAGAAAPVRLWLWYYCNSSDGMSAAEFDLSFPGNELDDIGGTTMLNGYLNAGDGDQLLLAVGGCPAGPRTALRWTFAWFNEGLGDFCLVPSAATGTIGTVDCNTINPQLWPIDQVGYRSGGGAAACVHELCAPVSVEEQSWGAVKSLYR